MPKPQAEKQPALEPIKTAVSHGYRVERRSQFEWHPLKTTFYSDGSFIEEAIFKPDTFEIVTRKLYTMMKDEGQVDYLKKRDGSVKKANAK